MSCTDSGYSSNSTEKNKQYGVEVLEKKLFISGEIEARDIDFLKTHGITAIISIQLKKLPQDVVGFIEGLDGGEYLHISISDTVNVNIMEHFDRAIKFINENKTTLVHCQAGISRSATLCLAYMIQKHKLTLDEAFQQLKKCRKCIGPNFSFLGQLKSFEEKMRECDF